MSNQAIVGIDPGLTVFEATLNVPPKPLARPIVRRDGRTVPPSREHIGWVQEELFANGFVRWAQQHEGEPLAVGVHFVKKRPKKGKFIVPVGSNHGDIDNFLKLLLEAINDYIDDCWVVRVVAEKTYGDEGCYRLQVKALGVEYGLNIPPLTTM